jgi:hypothetical protein
VTVKVFVPVMDVLPAKPTVAPPPPSVTLEALIPPIVIDPAVLVEDPVSIVTFPELDVVPLALPELMAKLAELVDGAFVDAVSSRGAWSAVAK